MAAMNINGQEYEKLIQGDMPVLVEFWAPWCVYCRRIGPAYEKVAEQLAAQRDNGFKLYWIACGVEDFLYEDNVIYRQYLDEKQYPYEYHESAGGHSWDNWMDYLTIFAQRLF